MKVLAMCISEYNSLKGHAVESERGFAIKTDFPN